MLVTLNENKRLEIGYLKPTDKYKLTEFRNNL